MKQELINQIYDFLDKNRQYKLRKLQDEILGDFTVTTQEVYGGREGSGEEHWVVLSVKHNESISYWKIPGYYQSYDGAELEINSMFEVKPVEKTVIIWE